MYDHFEIMSGTPWRGSCEISVCPFLRNSQEVGKMGRWGDGERGARARVCVGGRELRCVVKGQVGEGGEECVCVCMRAITG